MYSRLLEFLLFPGFCCKCKMCVRTTNTSFERCWIQTLDISSSSAADFSLALLIAESTSSILNRTQIPLTALRSLPGTEGMVTELYAVGGANLSVVFF